VRVAGRPRWPWWSETWTTSRKSTTARAAKSATLALQRVALLLERGKRQVDGVARVGGEVFALILPDTDAHGAFVIAERLRCEVREEFANDVVPLTISFGVVS
jgi:diguanylate cyclase